jgi:hypothetical protein
MSAQNTWKSGPHGKKSGPFFTLLQQIDPGVQCERTFDWLYMPVSATRLPLETEIIEALQEHCWDTRGNNPKKEECDPTNFTDDEWVKARAKRLEIDFFLPNHQLAIEFDERQHFSLERRFSLSCYGTLKVPFDLQRWTDYCAAHHAVDTDPPCRDWMRAYRDSVRDIRSAENGLTLQRVYFRDFDAVTSIQHDALARLRQTLSI